MTKLENENPGIENRSEDKLMVNVKEASALLNVSEKTIHRLVTRGFLKKCKALRHVLIPRESINAFVKSNLN